jgi:hypothetical protein
MPFYNEDDAPRTGETMTDVFIRDQVRRCELMIGRKMTECELAALNDAWRFGGRVREPSEAGSEPTLVHPAPPPVRTPFVAAAAEPGVGDGHGRDAIRGGDAEGSAEVRLNALEEEVQGLRAELDEVKTQLDEVKARLAECEASNSKATTSGKEADREPDYDRDNGHVTCAGEGRRFALSGMVPVALVALVWVVTEAMLHSKRLSDGYGPYINGGYNGLGSVLIFGSWTEFSTFVAAVLYLGESAFGRALGR